MRIIITWIFWSLVAVATAFAEEPNEDAITRVEKSWYDHIENDIKQEFESAVAIFQKNPRNVSKQVLDLALIGFKTLSYNKANIHAECAGEVARSKTPTDTPTDFEARYKRCLDPKLGELLINYKIESDYIGYFKDKGTVRCEIEARLFERERLLPPYDFLKGDGVALYDYRLLNQCLKSKL